jgi:hypothetical protein
MIPIKPMLAVSGKIFSGKGWIFEPKIDGTRYIAYIRMGQWNFRTEGSDQWVLVILRSLRH